ncbi:hypothetical protein CHS0354_021816 [Potamilus streckersoni]|uniref:Uncharacterized protein n=1 Tax=Potamilus streckersoni TaxID=2493646 RepID=A0AAE0S4S4_9BIVA|nr:hypothetical protein CHS0354_021816 [Potamilus streckersoni]
MQYSNYTNTGKAYVFPDPEESISRNGLHVELQDPAWLSSDYCLNKDEFLRLVDVEEPDKDLEIMPEEVYVEAVTKCKKENGSSLTFKRGKIFKQKLTLADGTIGFGWKRCRTGIKVWGFYSTCMVKFNHIPKK